MNPDIDLQQIQNDLERYEFGRQVRVVVNSPGWEVLTNTMQNMRDEAIDKLVALPPGDSTVIAAHAAASAVSDFVNKFLDATASAVAFANNPSEEVVAYLTQVRESFDVMKAMGQE